MESACGGRSSRAGSPAPAETGGPTTASRGNPALPTRQAGLVGLDNLVVVPLLLVAIAITIVCIPLALAGALLFALVAWGLVYGRFAVGARLLSLADAGSRWLALVVGLVLGSLLSPVAVVGDLLNFPVFLVGFGARSVGRSGVSGPDRRATTATPSGETPVE